MPENAAYTHLETEINHSSSLFLLPLMDFQNAHDDLLSSLTLIMPSELS